MRILLSLLVLLSVQQSWAYDEDVHFYGTYAMARYSGIGHETALTLAIANQWTDESKLTGPIPTSFLNLRQNWFAARRLRLFHFAVSFLDFESSN